jgi:hypothetical protein
MMPSTFAWLDHSEEQRRRMLDVVGLFEEKGTIDELGIGSVRDAISDLLFPGVSTLHTRAKYLLFLPWIFVGMERDRVSSRAAADRLKRDEIRIIEALLAGNAGDGIIGGEARERLTRFPSVVFWSALERYGIRKLPVTRTQYLRSLDGYYVRLRGVTTNDDGEPDGAAPRNWHAGLPRPPDDLFEQQTFDLSSIEAEYLAEQMIRQCGSTFLAHLVAQTEVAVKADMPWMHPAAATAPPPVADHLRHARMFSDVMHGAALLYNLILAEKVRDTQSLGGELTVDPGRVERYERMLDEWAQRIDDRRRPLATWDQLRFWELVRSINPRIPWRTNRFINAWFDVVRTRADRLADDHAARDLVARREMQVKRGLARVSNQRALERWSGESAVAPLEFRWTQVRQITDDIVAGRTSAKEVVGARA